MDKKWITFFYEANIPFNVWHPTFIKVVKTTSEFQTYYKPSSYYGLSINLLKQSTVDVSKHTYNRTWNSIHKYGMTICSNGWDNFTQCPLLNVMFDYPNVDVFIGAIDTTWEHKDAQYIHNALVWYIESVGVENIVHKFV